MEVCSKDLEADYIVAHLVYGHLASKQRKVVNYLAAHPFRVLRDFPQILSKAEYRDVGVPHPTSDVPPNSPDACSPDAPFTGLRRRLTHSVGADGPNSPDGSPRFPSDANLIFLDTSRGLNFGHGAWKQVTRTPRLHSLSRGRTILRLTMI